MSAAAADWNKTMMSEPPNKKCPNSVPFSTSVPDMGLITTEDICAIPTGITATSPTSPSFDFAVSIMRTPRACLSFKVIFFTWNSPFHKVPNFKSSICRTPVREEQKSKFLAMVLYCPNSILLRSRLLRFFILLHCFPALKKQQDGVGQFFKTLIPLFSMWKSQTLSKFVTIFRIIWAFVETISEVHI